MKMLDKNGNTIDVDFVDYVRDGKTFADREYAYDMTLTRFNLAVNNYCSARLALPESKAERLILEHAEKVRDAANDFLAAAEERRRGETPC